MKAARLVGPRQFEIVSDLPVPQIEDGEVLVKMETLSICGSDLIAYDRVMAEEDYPLRPGVPCHECCGVIVESRDENLKVGQRVVALTFLSGGLLEYISISGKHVVPVPDTIEPSLAVLAQPVGTVIFAVQQMERLLGSTVVILGQGPIGLGFTDLVARAGASRVIVTDVLQYRLDMAMRIGATHTINAASEDVIERVREITGGAMADYSVEAAGVTETCNQAFQVLRMHGTTIVFGVPHGDPVIPLDWNSMYARLPKMIVANSARAGELTNAVRTAVDLMAQGRLDPSYMVTHKLPFTEVGRAYELFSRKQENAVKVLISV